ncbi:hypothetical protein [Halalkalicoccus tibetensis]|uniref:DUF983 domain-containing protein n=1 Tax=Halalkalicoccus tibetensis TaxID=175632 RepID=A0ABD5V4R3_9EURY
MQYYQYTINVRSTEFELCELCDKPIFTEVTECPHCGFDPKANVLKLGIGIAIFFGLVGVIVPFLWTVAASGVVIAIISMLVTITPTNPTT